MIISFLYVSDNQVYIWYRKLFFCSVLIGHTSDHHLKIQGYDVPKTVFCGFWKSDSIFSIIRNFNSSIKKHLDSIITFCWIIQFFNFRIVFFIITCFYFFFWFDAFELNFYKYWWKIKFNIFLIGIMEKNINISFFRKKKKIKNWNLKKKTYK